MMKSTFVYILTLFIALSFGKVAIANSSEKLPKKNRVVKVIPSRPYVKVFKPVHIKHGYVWIEGHWKWNRKTHNYVWVNGYLVKSKRGKTWVGGNWRSKNGGWVYIPGKWA